MPNKLISGLFFCIIALTVITPTAQAKLSSTPDSNSNYEIPNKFASRPGSPSFGQDFSQIPGLNLTTQQKVRLQEVQATMGNRLSLILTDDQMKTFKKLMASGKSPRSMVSSLSWKQMRQMRRLMSWQKKQLKSILDEEQMKLVEEFRKKRK